MSLIPKSKEELDKKLKDLELWIRINVEHMMMQYPSASYYHECPKCKTCYPFGPFKSYGVDSVVNWVYSIAKDSEITRWTLLAQMADEIKSGERD